MILINLLKVSSIMTEPISGGFMPDISQLEEMKANFDWNSFMVSPVIETPSIKDMILKRTPLEEIKSNTNWDTLMDGLLYSKDWYYQFKTAIEASPKPLSEYVKSVIIMCYEEIAKRVDWSVVKIPQHENFVLHPLYFKGFGSNANNLCLHELYKVAPEVVPNVYDIIIEYIPLSATPDVEFSELVDKAWLNSSISMLDWCHTHNKYLSPLIPQQEVDKCHNLTVLNWWKNNVAPANYVTRMDGWWQTKPDVVTWWLESGFGIEEAVQDQGWGGFEDRVVLLLHEEGYSMNQAQLKYYLGNLICSLTVTEFTDDYIDSYLEYFYDLYPDYMVSILEDAEFTANIMYNGGRCAPFAFFLRCGIPFNMTNILMDNLIIMDQAHFWESTGLELRHTPEGFFKVTFYNLKLGEWWIRMGFAKGEVYHMRPNNPWRHFAEPIKFLMKHGVQIEYTEELLDDLAMSRDQNHIRNYFNEFLMTGLELKYTHLFVDKCVKCKILEPLIHMITNNLPMPHTCPAEQMNEVMEMLAHQGYV